MGTNKALLLAVNFTLATLAVIGVGSPLSFLCPLLALHIWALELHKLSARAYVTVFVNALAGVSLGFVIGTLYTYSITAYLLALASVLILSQYIETIKPNPITNSVRVISLILVAALGIKNQALLLPFSIALISNLFVAMLIARLLYMTVYGPVFKKDATSDCTAQSKLGVKDLSLLLTFMPLVTLISIFPFDGFYVSLVIVSVMTMSVVLGNIRSQAINYLVANLCGGALAILGYLSYSFLLTTPLSPLLIAITVVFCCSFILGLVLYHGTTHNIAHFALSPFALLLIQSDRIDFNIYLSYQNRVFAVALGVAYASVALYLLGSRRLSK